LDSVSNIATAVATASKSAVPADVEVPIDVTAR
jgi:hypothetical protein